MQKELEAKYKSEIQKFSGFALMSTCGIKAINFLTQEGFPVVFSNFQVFSWSLAVILFGLGAFFIYRGLEIIEGNYSLT